MVNRRNDVYVELPPCLKHGNKNKDAKATISIGIVVPKEMEKKAIKFIDKASSEFSKSFKKFMKAESKKYEEEEDD